MMMRSLVCVAAAQQFFQPVAPTGFLQPGLRQANPAQSQAPLVQVVRVPPVMTPAQSTPASVCALAVLAGVFTGVAAATYATQGRARRVNMQEERLMVDALNTPTTGDPRTGNPFEPEGPRKAVEAYQPRGISDATVLKKQYIETDDEPWHSTSKQTVVVTKAQVEKTFEASLPFVEAEEYLAVALSKVETKDDVKKVLKEAIANGARAGGSVVASGEKLLKVFEEKGGEEALKARPKAPKAAGAQGGGWDGMKRAVATVHSTAGSL